VCSKMASWTEWLHEMSDPSKRFRRLERRPLAMHPNPWGAEPIQLGGARPACAQGRMRDIRPMSFAVVVAYNFTRFSTSWAVAKALVAVVVTGHI
jgi:hypothetical protein